VDFGQFTESNPWSSVEHVLGVGPENTLLRIEIIRQPSAKFDDNVGGTAWIDELRLEPIIPHSSR
jgi:hypothetical protein